MLHSLGRQRGAAHLRPQRSSAGVVRLSTPLPADRVPTHAPLYERRNPDAPGWPPTARQRGPGPHTVVLAQRPAPSRRTVAMGVGKRGGDRGALTPSPSSPVLTSLGYREGTECPKGWGHRPPCL